MANGRDGTPRGRKQLSLAMMSEGAFNRVSDKATAATRAGDLINCPDGLVVELYV
jgi:hypothetical protein